MPTVHDYVTQTNRGVLSPLLKSYNMILDSKPSAPGSEFRRSMQSIIPSKLSWTTTHRQRLICGVNLNVLAERHAALNFMAIWSLGCGEVRITRRVLFGTGTNLFHFHGRIGQSKPGFGRNGNISLAPLGYLALDRKTEL